MNKGMVGGVEGKSRVQEVMGSRVLVLIAY
jgi:hypothetical protein